MKKDGSTAIIPAVVPKGTLYSYDAKTVFEGHVTALRVNPDVEANFKVGFDLTFEPSGDNFAYNEDLLINKHTSVRELYEGPIFSFNNSMKEQFTTKNLIISPPAMTYDSNRQLFQLYLPPGSSLSVHPPEFWTLTGLPINNSDEVSQINDSVLNSMVIEGSGPFSADSNVIMELVNSLSSSWTNFSFVFLLSTRERSFQGSETFTVSPQTLVSELQNGLNALFWTMGFRKSGLQTYISYTAEQPQCIFHPEKNSDSFPKGRISLELKSEFSQFFHYDGLEDGEKERKMLIFDNRREFHTKSLNILTNRINLLTNLYPVRVTCDRLGHSLAYLTNLGYVSLFCDIESQDCLKMNSFLQPFDSSHFAIQLFDFRGKKIVFKFDTIIHIDITYTKI